MDYVWFPLEYLPSAVEEIIHPLHTLVCTTSQSGALSLQHKRNNCPLCFHLYFRSDNGRGRMESHCAQQDLGSARCSLESSSYALRLLVQPQQFSQYSSPRHFDSIYSLVNEVVMTKHLWFGDNLRCGVRIKVLFLQPCLFSWQLILEGFLY